MVASSSSLRPTYVNMTPATFSNLSTFFFNKHAEKHMTKREEVLERIVLEAMEVRERERLKK